GIGTTTPAAKLEIKANSAGPTGGLRISAPGSANTWNLNHDSNENLSVYRNNSAVPFLMIDPALGNVGIGTSNPNQKLTVCGNIRATGTLFASSATVSTAQGNTCPDYVFDDDYAPMPLDALHDYVKCEHHLPHMPSAAEVQRDGLDLG